MNLMELFIKVGVDDQATGKISKIGSAVGKGLRSAAKIGVAAIGAASTAIGALGKIGLDYNKQMETYTTNFEVMMGDAEAAAKKVNELKEMSARTPFELGDLANATQTLLAFNVPAADSTGVLKKLGDISLGNVRKLESLTRAYGKMNASQKVTLEDINMMIDAGFNPLLIVAEQTGKTMTEVYDDISKGEVSFEQITGAINTATSAGGQFYQGMAKASRTTAGLISTLKDNATALVGEVYQSISEGLTSTVLPAAIDAIGELTEAFRADGVEGMIAAAGEMLGSLLNTIVEYTPKVIEMAVSLVEALVRGLSENKESIATGAVQIITTLATGILDMLPDIIALGTDLIVAFATSIGEALPTFIPQIVRGILTLIEAFTAPEHAEAITGAAIAIINGLIDGILGAIPLIVEAVPVIIENLIASLIALSTQITSAIADLLPTLIPAVISIVVELLPQLVNGIVAVLVENFGAIIGSLIECGVMLIKGLIQGILSVDIVSVVKSIGKGIIGGVKSLFGIHSPSKVFDWIGRMVMAGFQQGIETGASGVENAMHGVVGNVIQSAVGSSSGLASALEAAILGGTGVIGENVIDGLYSAYSWFKEGIKGLTYLGEYELVPETRGRGGRRTAQEAVTARSRRSMIDRLYETHYHSLDLLKIENRAGASDLEREIQKVAYTSTRQISSAGIGGGGYNLNMTK